MAQWLLHVLLPSQLNQINYSSKQTTTQVLSITTTTKQYQLQQQPKPYQLQQQWQHHLEKPKIGILHVSITMILVWTEFNLCDNKHYVGLFLPRLVCFALTNEIVFFNKLYSFVINWM